MNRQRQRLVLTLVWFAGMLVCLGIVLSYMRVTDSRGVSLLIWPDVVVVLKSVLSIYAVYLGGIVAFWFTTPFKVKADASRDRIRFWIALIGTIIINAAYVAGLSIGYWDSAANLDDIVDSRQVVWWLSFIVAPPNLHFFGLSRVASA